jgi:hypothetical protein
MARPKPGKGQLPGLESGPVPLLPIRCAVTMCRTVVAEHQQLTLPHCLRLSQGHC